MFVLDCSAAVAITLGTSEGKRLEGLMYSGETAIAPEIYYAEIAHVFAKYARGGIFSISQALSYEREACLLVDRFYSMEDFHVEALSESLRLNHSSYDLFYVILAKRSGSVLFTLDKKLQTLCLRNGVSCV